MEVEGYGEEGRDMGMLDPCSSVLSANNRKKYRMRNGVKYEREPVPRLFLLQNKEKHNNIKTCPEYEIAQF